MKKTNTRRDSSFPLNQTSGIFPSPMPPLRQSIQRDSTAGSVSVSVYLPLSYPLVFSLSISDTFSHSSFSLGQLFMSISNYLTLSVIPLSSLLYSVPRSVVSYHIQDILSCANVEPLSIRIVNDSWGLLEKDLLPLSPPAAWGWGLRCIACLSTSTFTFDCW